MHFLLSALALSGALIVSRMEIDVPYLCYSEPNEGIWSIGIYDVQDDGRSLNLRGNEENPVLTAADVMDMPARFVADPLAL